MKRILDPIRVEYVDGRRWRLLEAFEYRIGSPDGPERVVVPAGFLTDFASIPRALWWLFHPTGPWAPAALVHDWLYHSPVVQSGATSRTVDREEADRIFKEVIAVKIEAKQYELAQQDRTFRQRLNDRAKIAWLVATKHVMFRAVRLFGGHAFLG